MTDDWDDFGFKTLFHLYVADADGRRKSIGGVKIGRFGMESPARVDLPESFEELDSSYFSVGQDDQYYVALNSLGVQIRNNVLRALRDVAFNADLFEQARHEAVMNTSLLREVSTSSVLGQFNRLAHGGNRLSGYYFTYFPPGSEAAALEFAVAPDSQPPSNIHVIIGRNGVGKTRALHHMSRAFVESDALTSAVGEIRIGSDTSTSEEFAGLVSVAFSAFDPFDPLPVTRTRADGRHYVYVGLKTTRAASENDATQPESVLVDPAALARQFSQSLSRCATQARSARWLRAIATLESDPMFAEASLPRLVESIAVGERGEAEDSFSALSSGHKIVLLTVTHLVEAVEERTLVLIDEPESHLHPPLLAALIRALSDLMSDLNGVAIIATHSPVVLQEVPRTCVWKLRRSGDTTVAERPSLETFGENVGVLTREVFGLEVTQSGFHRLIAEAVHNGVTYQELVDQFDDHLGGEATLVARALLAERDGTA